MEINIEDIISVEEIEIDYVVDLTIESDSNYFLSKKDGGKILVHNSGKTWSCIDFLVYLASRIEQRATLNIIKETYNSFKTTLYEDFNRRLPDFGIYSPFEDIKEVSTFNIFGLKINLLGADKPSKYLGAGCDYFWINESIEVQRAIFDQSELRCRKFWFQDYNPSVEKHYIYDNIIPRNDVVYLKTTWLDNPFISPAEKKKILSWEPTHPEDRNLPESERRPHPTNIDQGTADEYNWRVYGLGERAAQKGVVYPHWKITDQYPTDKESEPLAIWLDFGYNAPTAAGWLKYYRGEIYLKEFIYEPDLTSIININNPDQISIEQRFEENNVNKKILILADNARPENITDLRNSGYNIYPAPKFPGSVQHGIDILKRHKVNIYKDSINIIHERNSYKYQYHSASDTYTNDPVKANDHHMDGIRGVALYYNRIGLL